MRRQRMRILLILVLAIFFCAIVGLCYMQKISNNPIKDRIAVLELERISACKVRYLEDGKYYEYTETDPDKVKAMYEAVRHMKFKEEDLFNVIPIGMSINYKIISFIQDDEPIVIFSYWRGHVSLSLDGDKFHAEITNLEKLEKTYGWKTILKEMLLAAEAEKEAETTEATEITDG